VTRPLLLKRPPCRTISLRHKVPIKAIETKFEPPTTKRPTQRTAGAMIDAIIDVVVVVVIGLMIATSIFVASIAVVAVRDTLPTLMWTFGFVAAPAPSMASVPLL
jgi:hypothetical protein